jgi:tetratricopeptide (TPR) repeat protein
MLASAVVWLQMIAQRRFTSEQVAQRMLYVTSPEAVRRLSLSFDSLLADLYWIRAIQYYGGTRLSDEPNKTYDLLYPLLDITTTLDPRFGIAYRFGAFFLSERAPGGAGRSDQAIRLLEKGIRANPDRWEYPHDIAFVYYRQGDFVTAAEWFNRAADVPEAATWLRPMAAVTLARGGDVATARFLWQNILDTSEEDWIKGTAERSLLQLDAMEQIAALERITRRYEASTGAPPQSWQMLVQARLLRGIPVDPTGAPYELNPWWGDVTLSRQSSLWPLPPQLAIP